MDLLSQLEAAFCEESEEEERAPAAPPPAKRQRPTLQAGEASDKHQRTTEQAQGAGQQGEEQLQQQQEEEDRQQQQQQEAQLQAAAEVPPSSPQQAHCGSHASLLELNDVLLLRVLAALSPEDLLCVSQTCRLLNAAASDAALWRRLYHARWPDGTEEEDAEHVQGSSWRVLYIERDAQAVLEARASAPSDELLPIYVQMATARRSEALSMANAEGLFRSPAGNNRSMALASKVDAFRRQHRLTDASHHVSHSCGKAAACRWAQLDASAWICERSGFVHVCDANCSFRELDQDGEGYVCQVSGRCFAAEMLTEREEHAGDEERGQTRSVLGGGAADEDEDWLADEGASGRLGRAFVAGYNAQSPAAFFRKFGYSVS